MKKGIFAIFRTAFPAGDRRGVRGGVEVAAARATGGLSERRPLLMAKVLCVSLGEVVEWLLTRSQRA